MSQFRKSRPFNSGRPVRNYQNRGGSQNRRQPKKAYIHPSKFVQSASPQTEQVYVPEHSFKDFELVEIIKTNLESMSYQHPSPIQDQAIPHGLEGKDIVGIANTGTGKTAAFAIPVLNRLITERASKAIILAPTRELAEQIEQQCRVIGRGSGLDGVLLIGGVPMGPQLRDLKNNPRIIIGTPGRIKDHLTRGSLKIKDCNIAVLDEVDRMLDMGFVHDITHILSNTSTDRQGYYFSATLDARVREVINKFSKNVTHITVKSGDTSSNVEQNIVMHNAQNKLDKLHDILIHDSTSKTIIFDDTHRLVEKLSKELAVRGFKTEAIHGGKSQSQRKNALKKFKNNEVTVLVATDVAARGLDVSDVSHVINYSLPQSYDDYVHRIGRTGRAGKIGNALTFIDEKVER